MQARRNNFSAAYNFKTVFEVIAMKKHIRNIAIVAVLVVAVVAVVIVKQGKRPQKTGVPHAIAQVAESVSETATASAPIRGIPRLVDLGAGKCIPCKMMAPILEDLKKSNADKFEVQFVDVWQNPDSGRKYGIRVIPTQIFFAPDGKELFRHEGFFGKEDILAKWKELGFTFNGNNQ